MGNRRSVEAWSAQVLDAAVLVLALVDADLAEQITERLELLRLSKASLSMTVGLYSSLESDGLDELEQSIVNVAPIETTDEDERVHRIWPVTDLTRINTATSLLSAAQVVLVGGVADYMASIRWFHSRILQTNGY